MKGFVRSLPITTKVVFTAILYLGGKLQLDRSNIMTMKQSIHSIQQLFFSSYRKKSIWEGDAITQTKNMARKQLSIQHTQFKVCLFCVFFCVLVFFFHTEQKYEKDDQLQVAVPRIL